MVMGGSTEQQESKKEITKTTWGTWEELLLACAVKRHGFNDWDTISLELQSRTSLSPLLTTAHHCRLKFIDLRRRFSSSPPNNNDNDFLDRDFSDDNDDDISWLDELKRIRVSELRREVERRDGSILSLQLKVKKLEEEREQSLKDDDDDRKSKSDLDDSTLRVSKTDKFHQHQQPDRSEPDKFDAQTGEPDTENHSVNESNSTGPKSETEKLLEREEIKYEPEQVRVGPGNEPVKRTGERESDSDNGSSHTIGKEVVKTEESSELRDSAAHSKGETRESGEVQSSTSLTRKRNGKRRRRNAISEDSISACEEPMIKVKEDDKVRSQPFVEFLKTIRAHQHSSSFERRLQSQRSEDYNNIVRQHVDLKAIESKLQKGSYSSCTLAFYRDLLLLFNNATLYFPKSSIESTAAHELRQIVSKELKQNKDQALRHHLDPSPEASETIRPSSPVQSKRSELEASDSLLAKHKSSAPIIVCRKRSSISSKPSSSSFPHKIENPSEEKKSTLDLKQPTAVKPSLNTVEEQGSVKSVKTKDKPVTGTRSSRRGKENVTSSSAPSKKQSTSPVMKVGLSNKAESSKIDDKKKADSSVVEKKRSAADFLKRIKRNSLPETPKTSSRRGEGNSGEQKERGSAKDSKGKDRTLRQSSDRKNAKKEENSPSKRSVGRPPKKTAEVTTAITKRGRENSGKETSKQPTKRSRR